MATEWSDSIVICDLSDEPALSDELTAVTDSLAKSDSSVEGVVLDLSDVTYLNSSNIAHLLRLRKLLAERGAHLRVAGVQDVVWSVMQMTGLDKVFEFSSDKATALASLQLGA